MGVKISYKGSVISETDTAGTETIKTAGIYCEGDIVVTYTPGAVTDDRFRRWDVTVTGEIISARVYFLQDDWLRDHSADDNLVVAIIPKFTIVHDSAKSQLGVFLGMNGVWAASGTTAYKTFSAYVNKSGSITPRLRTFGLTDSSDIGDVGITTDGRLNVIATASNPLAPGEYCVVAWLM